MSGVDIHAAPSAVAARRVMMSALMGIRGKHTPTGVNSAAAYYFHRAPADIARNIGPHVSTADVAAIAAAHPTYFDDDGSGNLALTDLGLADFRSHGSPRQRVIVNT